MNDPLGRAVALWKVSSQLERLSDDTRRRILRETLEAQETEPVPTRLRSAAWSILAGALPVAAIALLALFLGDQVVQREGATRVRATKAAGEVIFSIANGGRTHNVYKSSVPNKFRSSSRIQVRGGSFRDTVDDDSGLVFYRIE